MRWNNRGDVRFGAGKWACLIPREVTYGKERKNGMRVLLINRVFGILVSILVSSTFPAEAESMVRWHGQALDSPSTPFPEGALLNPNPLYWQEVRFTGVRLTYNGRELPSDGRFGRRWIGGKKGGEISITFTNPCIVREIAMKLKGEGEVYVEAIEDGSETATWHSIMIRRRADDVPLSTEGQFWVRLKANQEVAASRWRIRLDAGVAVNAISLWGSGPEQPVEPVAGEVRKKFPIAYESLPGAHATSFSDHVYWSWQRPLLEDKKMTSDGAVWAQHDKWDRLADAPILPPHATLNTPVRIVMARNEYEGALLTLTSLKDRVGESIHDSGIYREFHPGAQEFRMQVGPVEGPTPEKVTLTLRVAGTMRSQLWGVVPGPLFSAENMPGSNRMLQYFTNGKAIADYPLIALPPCGSQIFWLEVRTDGAAPGMYRTTIAARPGPWLPVTIEVLPVTLPTPRVWVNAWTKGGVGTTWPFTEEAVLKTTVGDKISRGISSFYGVPVPGSEAEEARQQKEDVYFFHAYIIPGRWVHHGYCKNPEHFDALTEQEHATIQKHVTDVVEQFKEAGVEYNDWVGELWDEPGEANSELAATAAKWVKKVDPNVQIYLNPSFPKISGFRTMSAAADCFVPFWGNWFKKPIEDWQAEIRSGRINAFYGVQGSNRSELHEELVGHYRIMPWHSFALNLQGWGFYSYYSPRGDPYTDYDPPGSETDYQVVYPGPLGPVPSRQAEAMRDGWEDYRLLTLLAASDAPEAREAIEWATDQIPMDREPLTGTGLENPVDFEAIRLRLLRIAAEVAPDEL